MPKKKAVILGAGMVGSIMAADLAADESFDAAIADKSRDALDRAKIRAGKPIETIETDLSDLDAVKRVIASADVVLGALASAIGYQTLRAVIEAGKPYCDISFMPENALDLDALAKERGVTAIVDCGVAPGMSNLLAGYGAAQLEKCERIEIYVGGIPREPKPPFMYKAAFSPTDVIEEYTRPARIVENSKIIEREALSEPEIIEFEGVGELEAFNTDGLRSIAYTLNAPNMKEKTLRWPGHIDLMRVFRETGLFSKEPITLPSRGTVGEANDALGQSVRPLDLTSALLFPLWTYEEGEEDLTVMRIIVEGIAPHDNAVQQKRVRHTWDMLDFYDRATHATSMARTTALPCTILARMLPEIATKMTGVIVPEMLGNVPGLTESVLSQLEKRGVRFRFQSSELH